MQSLWIRSIIGSGFCFAICVANAAQNKIEKVPLQPTASMVKQIEAILTLPKGSHSLAQYTRYYSEQRAGRDTHVNAIYVMGESAGRVVIVERDEMPRIQDGGCDVVRVRYSVTLKKILSVSCNGVG